MSFGATKVQCDRCPNLILMMIVIMNVYTGLLFSLMTNGELLSWPDSLKELIQDKQNCIFSGHVVTKINSSGIVTATYGRVRFLFINPALEGKLRSAPGATRKTK